MRTRRHELRFAAVMTVIAIFLTFLAARLSFADVPLGQSMKIYNSDGTAATSGNITILISDVSDCNGTIYNTTFQNEIDRGVFSRTIDINLTYGKTYYECVRYNNVQISGPFKVFGIGSIGPEDLNNASFTFYNITIVMHNLTAGNLTINDRTTIQGRLDAVGSVYTPNVYSSVSVNSPFVNLSNSGNVPWVLTGDAGGVAGSEGHTVSCWGNATNVGGIYDYSSAAAVCIRQDTGIVYIQPNSLGSVYFFNNIGLTSEGVFGPFHAINLAGDGHGIYLPTDIGNPNIPIFTIVSDSYGQFFDLANIADPKIKFKIADSDVVNISQTGGIAASDTITTDANLTIGDNDLHVSAGASRVGIGTNNPQCKLTVAGAAPETPAIADNDNTIAIYGDGAAYFKGRDVTNDIEFIVGSASTGSTFYGSMTNHDVQLRTGNANRVLLDHSDARVVIADVWNLSWGSSGVTSPDTHLWRAGPDRLKTTGNITVEAITFEKNETQHRIYDNSTCVVIQGDTATFYVC